jgi:hypothetical protein
VVTKEHEEISAARPTHEEKGLKKLYAYAELLNKKSIV